MEERRKNVHDRTSMLEKPNESAQIIHLPFGTLHIPKANPALDNIFRKKSIATKKKSSKGLAKSKGTNTKVVAEKSSRPTKRITSDHRKDIAFGEGMPVRSVRQRFDRGKEDNLDDKVTQGDTSHLKMKHRMSPKGLFEMLPLLSEEQREAVRSIGFGGLLNLGFSEIDLQFARWLVENFDPYSRLLNLSNGQSFRITEEDVYLTLGLPRGHRHVVDIYSKDDDDFIQFLTEWRNQWGVTRTPMTTKMPEIIIKKGAGDEFKRDFVLYVSATFIKGLQIQECPHQLLCSLVDVDHIREYNWCEYTIRSLVECVCEWKKKTDRFFRGPLTFLMLLYLDRVEFKVRDVPRVFPTITGWTSKEISKRVNGEKDTGFGKGSVVDKIHIAPEVERETQVDQGNAQGADNCGIPAKSPENDVDNFETEFSKQNYIDELAFVGKKLVYYYEYFGKLIAKGHKHFPGSEALLKFHHAASLMFSNFSNTQGQSQPVHIDHVSNIPICPDEFFSRPSVLETITAMENAYQDRISNPFPHDPSTNLVTSPIVTTPQHDKDKEQHDSETGPPVKANQKATIPDYAFDAPSFDLGISPICTPIEHEKNGEKNDTKNLSLEKDKQKAPMVLDCFPSAGPIAQTSNVVKDAKGATKTNTLKVRIQSKRLNCRLMRPKRQPENLPMVLRSPFFERHVNVSTRLTNNEKLIADYAFLDDQWRMNEMLYNDGKYFIRREHFLSLAGMLDGCDEVEPRILDIWSHLMNLNDRKRSLGSPKRLFFSTKAYQQFTLDLPEEQRIKSFCTICETEMEWACISKIADVDLVFFVVNRSEHIYVVCLNFMKSTIDILDNKKPVKRNTKTNKYVDSISNIAKGFTTLLKSRNDARGTYVKDFKEKLLQVSWKANSDQVDFAVYAMLHMDSYMGKVEAWEFDAEKNDDLLLKCLRARFCYLILSSETNNLKDEVLEKAKTINKCAL